MRNVKMNIGLGLVLILLLSILCINVYAADITVTPQSSPNVTGIGAPVANITILGFQNYLNQTGTGLFNGVQENQWNTNNVYYWYNSSSLTGEYLEMNIPKNCNIWRSGASAWNTQIDALKIMKYNGASYDDVTNLYSLSTSAISSGQWEKFIQGLPAGRYKFMFDSDSTERARLDSEWYVEELAASAPNAPTNPNAVGSNSNISLSWTASTGATSYNVKRSVTSGGAFTTIASNITETTYLDTNVTNGTTYYYVISAVNTNGESSNSVQVSYTASEVGQYTSDVIPRMVGYDSPSPITISTDSDAYGLEAFRAFNDTSNDYWSTMQSANGGHYVKIDFGIGNSKKISKLTLTSYEVRVNEHSIKNWELWASNNNVDFIKLTQGLQLNNNSLQEYIFNNSTAYRYYKLVILDSYETTAMKTNGIAEMEMMENTIDVPANLTAVAGNSEVNLTWGAVSGATGYNVKRSLTPGGPYTNIASNVTALTHKDTNVINGTTYYYVVTAIKSGAESGNSNEATATIEATGGNKAILEITMSNGTIKEYDLTASELQAFLDWYDAKSSGIGKSYYVMVKKNNIKPFLGRKEYLAFDKILSFEVKDYND